MPPDRNHDKVRLVALATPKQDPGTLFGETEL